MPNEASPVVSQESLPVVLGIRQVSSHYPFLHFLELLVLDSCNALPFCGTLFYSFWLSLPLPYMLPKLPPDTGTPFDTGARPQCPYQTGVSSSPANCLERSQVYTLPERAFHDSSVSGRLPKITFTALCNDHKEESCRRLDETEGGRGRTQDGVRFPPCRSRAPAVGTGLVPD